MDREFAVTVVIALFLAVTVKVLTPTATAGGADPAQCRTESALSTRSDMSWLVSP